MEYKITFVGTEIINNFNDLLSKFFEIDKRYKSVTLVDNSNSPFVGIYVDMFKFRVPRETFNSFMDKFALCINLSFYLTEY